MTDYDKLDNTTPEWLQEIRGRHGTRWSFQQPATSKQAFLDRDVLLDYIEVLHAELASARGEMEG